MNEPANAMIPQIPGLVPVAVLAKPLRRLLKIFPDTVAVIPIPVTTVFKADTVVELKL